MRCSTPRTRPPPCHIHACSDSSDQEHVRLDDILAERNRRFELCDGTRGIAGGDLSHRQLGAQHRPVGVDLDRTLDVIRTA